jgi:hypothetical protein
MEFSARRSTAKYCSVACKQRRYYQRGKEEFRRTVEQLRSRARQKRAVKKKAPAKNGPAKPRSRRTGRESFAETQRRFWAARAAKAEFELEQLRVKLIAVDEIRPQLELIADVIEEVIAGSKLSAEEKTELCADVRKIR